MAGWGSGVARGECSLFTVMLSVRDGLLLPCPEVSRVRVSLFLAPVSVRCVRSSPKLSVSACLVWGAEDFAAHLFEPRLQV